MKHKKTDVILLVMYAKNKFTDQLRGKIDQRVTSFSVVNHVKRYGETPFLLEKIMQTGKAEKVLTETYCEEQK